MQKFAKIATIETVKTVLDKLGVTVRFNVITGRIDISGSKSHDPINILPVDVRDQLSKAGYKYSMRDIKDFLSIIAEENRYNPVQEMILNTVWDGQDRINSLIHDIVRVTSEAEEAAEAEEEEAKEAESVEAVEAVYIRCWLHQCVSMAFNSKGEYGADGVLVLVGKQGNGKTMLVSKLAVNYDWFIGGRLLSLKKDNVDNVMINTSRWITELCYVDNLSSREKAFLTASSDTSRGSDISRGIRKPRLTSFCATLNEMPEAAKNAKTAKSEGLSRRLWVIDTANMDTNRIKALNKEWVKQLWRQVYEELYLPDPQGFRVRRRDSE